MAANRNGRKNEWTLFFLVLAGIVLGGFLGKLATDISFLKWLNFGYDFGMDNPLTINLKILYLQFKIMLSINIASIAGIAIAIFIYRKI